MVDRNVFKRMLSSIQSELDMYDEIASVYHRYGVEHFLGATDVVDDIINILQIIFEDAEDEMISYWVFELDFGRKWTENSVTDSYGHPIKLQTSDDLYNYLTKK